MSAHPLPALPEDLTRHLHGLDAPALWWLSGYAAALAQGRAAPAPRPLAVAQESARLTVVYGSQTGNARRVAEHLARDAEQAGLAVRLLRADAYPLRELAGERLLHVVISTQGEGDPPDDSLAFVEHVTGKRAPKLPELKFAVLGLGDSSYPQFNAVARRLDARFAELGAQRELAAGEADVEFDLVASPWRAQAVALAKEQLGAAPVSATVTPLRPPLAPVAAMWSRDNPFGAELLLGQRLTARGSRKDVRHLEFSLAGSGLGYEPGDALGVWHRNPDSLIDAVLAATRVDADDALREALATTRELTRISRPFLTALAEKTGSEVFPDAELAAVMASHQVIDALRRWPATWTAESLLATLRPMAPRLYSIASSRKAVGDEAHLVVDVLAYDAFGAPHAGAASAHLASLAEGESARVYLEPNERFRLTPDDSRDVIMIGPGTGVAPFRGFLQERAAVGARGRHWLFFGNPHFRSDFLYQLEWQAALKAGTLHELDLAFSRDGAAKRYVQHRIAQRGAQLHAWLDGGAHLYVCGSVAMGKDVHATLREVVARERGLDAETAEDWLRGLQRAGRYARDVY